MESIGRYEVVRPLGRGGMGQVYLARDPKLERQVAIKLLNRDDGGITRALFEREAKALAALNHPNIVTVFEIAEDGGGQFIAMEYLPGRPLRDLLQQATPARDELVAICGQVATALAAAHDAGILHRDIKPENVVVGKGWSVKVVDFGIARRLDAPVSSDPAEVRRTPKHATARAAELVNVFTRTLPLGGVGALPSTRASVEEIDATCETEAPVIDGMTRTVFGTPAYMAPEVLMGEASSTASDVYSLGVMLYECLTGRRPYEAAHLHEVIARVIDGEVVPAQLDDPLGPLIARMIDRDPAKRPPLSEIVKALGRRRSTIAAPPPRRFRLALLAALLVASVAGLIAWQVLRPEPQPVVAPVVVDRGPVAIANVELDLPSYGTAPDGATFAVVLAQLLDTARVATLSPKELRVEPPTLEAWQTHARAAKAKLLVRGSIKERGTGVRAHFEVIDLERTRSIATVDVDGDPDHVATLMLDIADRFAAIARPGSKVNRDPDPKLAANLLELGKQRLREHDSSRARTYFEQAVIAGPSAETWDLYARSLAMTAAKRTTVIEAAREAHRRAPAGPRKQILEANLLLQESRFREALAVVEPLEHEPLDKEARRDLMFAIGECHWHEGRHELGFRYFKRTLDLDATFAEAATHAGEYALARRDEATAREYLRVERFPTEYADFAVGRYEQLAAHGQPPFDDWANIVLGRPLHRTTPLPAELAPFEELTDAAVAGDAVAVDKYLAVILADLEPYTSYKATLLIHIAEVVVAANLREPSRRVLAELGRRAPTYNYRRLSILAAPMFGAPKFPRADLTERLATLTDAIDAELAGDRARAATLLWELVRNPTFEWDFVERVALKRNLDALGRTGEVRALCDDTLKPVVMRYVFRVVRKLCTR